MSDCTKESGSVQMHGPTSNYVLVNDELGIDLSRPGRAAMSPTMVSCTHRYHLSAALTRRRFRCPVLCGLHPRTCTRGLR